MAESFWADPPIAIAHRGGAAAFGKDKFKVENTFEAFEAAIKLGYKYLELDVIKTADNQVIILHVASYKVEAAAGLKDSPGPEKLQKMTLAELRPYLGRKIPTLADLLVKFPDVKLFVDAKTDEVVKPLAELIKNTDSYDRVVIGSFFPRRLIKAHEILGPKALINLNISRLPFKFLQMKRFLASPDHRFISSVHLPYVWATKGKIKWLQSLGIKVLVWWPNSERTIKRALNNGADGIISDNIKLLKEIIEERELKLLK